MILTYLILRVVYVTRNNFSNKSIRQKKYSSYDKSTTSAGSAFNIYTTLPDEPIIEVFIEHYQIRSINLNYLCQALTL